MAWMKVLKIQPILDNIRQFFPSDFNNIYLKYFGILQNLLRNYKILWQSTKVNKSYDIPWYFLCKIPHFHSVSFNCDALLAFTDFEPWQTKFFCLLLYRFAFRQHQQIFHHRQTKGNLSNITDTHWASPSVRDLCLFNHLISTMLVSVCLFVHVYVYPFVVVSEFISVCFLIYPNLVCLSVCLSSHLHVCQSSQLDVFLSVCLSAHLSITISVNLPNSVSVHLYVCQAACQAVCLCGC